VACLAEFAEARSRRPFVIGFHNIPFQTRRRGQRAPIEVLGLSLSVIFDFMESEMEHLLRRFP
jgi:hypothetical protein